MPTEIPSYVSITRHVSQEIKEFLKKVKLDKVAFLVDENTKKHCLPLVDVPFDLLIEIKAGENNKTINTCEYIWKQLTEANFSRKSILLNLGGGVIGDMGGFAAATYKRGLHFINIPTTLLSQTDASIGGKLGIDFGSLKNHIGMFKCPSKVIISSLFLNTLSERQLKSGFSEVIKHGLIYDANYWESLRNKSLNEMHWDNIIKRSVEIKHSIVESDPQEGGRRKILNFGHTLGHAIESYLLGSKNFLLHGEAIALGMLLENRISSSLGMLSQNSSEIIQETITSLFDLPKSPSFSELLPYLRQDKKNQGNIIKFSLLQQIGHCAFDIEVSEDIITESIENYNMLIHKS